MTKQTVELTHDMLAGKGVRFANYIIDYILKFGFGYLIGLVAGLMYSYLNVIAPYDFITNMNKFEEFMLGYIISLIYYFTFEVLTQRTMGKYITGTKVVTYEGEKPSAGTIFKRTLCRFIPFNPFSFLGESGRGWHDSIPDTYVVNIKKYNEALQLKQSFDEIGSGQ